MIISVGVILVPFGTWVARVFLYGGIGLIMVGVMVAFSGRFARKRDNTG